MSWPRVEEVGHPSPVFVVVDELLLSQGALHRAEYVIVAWGNVRAVQRIRQDGPDKFFDFLRNDFGGMKPRPFSKLVEGVSTRFGFKFGAGFGVGFGADKL
ncbi:unnamed protein product [Heligmosomoides polygyrus]|uniref:DUF3800 domain-containing protein n=1 Tax=Heligmosomoides polygyrus TaxID=6339 RepID=A0A183FVE4_HELPZ|nr:unnamed protein product [Heligmosomoides polygyrus]